VSTATITLRPVGAGDDHLLDALFAGARPELPAELLPMQRHAQVRHYEAAYPDAEHSIIEVDGEGVAQWRVARTPDEIRLVDISVAPAARGRGLASELIGRLQAEATTADLPLRLSVAAGNPALDLYLRLGFTVEGSDGMYSSMSWVPQGARLNTASYRAPSGPPAIGTMNSGSVPSSGWLNSNVPCVSVGSAGPVNSSENPVAAGVTRSSTTASRPSTSNEAPTSGSNVAAVKSSSMGGHYE
jgi:GNAT superfamily N-acetyltransferase